MPTPNRAAGTSVPAQAVINQLHERYGQTISRLMQENAELSAALDSIAQERDEYKSRILASSAPAEVTQDPLARAFGTAPEHAERGGRANWEPGDPIE
jgi:hypothetical protein